MMRWSYKIFQSWNVDNVVSPWILTVQWNLQGVDEEKGQGDEQGSAVAVASSEQKEDSITT